MSIFISYSEEKSRSEYEVLRRELEAEGIKVFDVKSMRVGEGVAPQLNEKIRSCSLCIFIATEESLVSPWCIMEIGAFWGAKKPVMIYSPDPNVQRGKSPVFEGDLWTSERPVLIENVVKKVYPHGRLVAPDDTGSAVVILSKGKSYKDPEKNEAIIHSIEAAGLSRLVQTSEVFQILDQHGLSGWSGLFLSMPYAFQFPEQLIRRIVEWVRKGGKLVMCGFELGQWHHQSNVNLLAMEFGFQFRSDVIVRAEEQDRDDPNNRGSSAKGYGCALPFRSFKSDDHPILNGVSEIILRNSCSLNLEPGCRPLVNVEPNRTRELDPEQAEWAREQDGTYKLAPADQIFLKARLRPDRAVMAEGPSLLSGEGTAIALGTWDFRAENHANDKFLGNLFTWLASR